MNSLQLLLFSCFLDRPETRCTSSKETDARGTIPFLDEDNALMMNEDELFNELNQTNSDEDRKLDTPPEQEETPPPLSSQEYETQLSKMLKLV